MFIALPLSLSGSFYRSMPLNLSTALYLSPLSLYLDLLSHSLSYPYLSLSVSISYLFPLSLLPLSRPFSLCSLWISLNPCLSLHLRVDLLSLSPPPLLAPSGAFCPCLSPSLLSISPPPHLDFSLPSLWMSLDTSLDRYLWISLSIDTSISRHLYINLSIYPYL